MLLKLMSFSKRCSQNWFQVIFGASLLVLNRAISILKAHFLFRKVHFLSFQTLTKWFFKNCSVSILYPKCIFQGLQPSLLCSNIHKPILFCSYLLLQFSLSRLHVSSCEDMRDYSLYFPSVCKSDTTFNVSALIPW